MLQGKNFYPEHGSMPWPCEYALEAVEFPFGQRIWMYDYAPAAVILPYGQATWVSGIGSDGDLYIRIPDDGGG